LMSTSEGETITVDDDGPSDYSTIQEAVEHASWGDTIQVSRGHYHGDVLITTPLELIGEDTESTLLEGNEGTTTIRITAEDVRVSGLTIRNGSTGINVVSDNCRIENVSCINQSNYGMAVHSATEVTIENCTIANSTNSAILVVDSAIIAHWNAFIGNGFRITGSEVGAWVDHVIDATNTVNGFPVRYLEGEDDVLVDGEMGQVIIANCRRVNVSSHRGLTQANLQLAFSTTVVIERCTIESSWEGIRVQDCDEVTIEDITVNDSNTGIALFYSSNIVIRRSWIADCEQTGISMEYSMGVRIDETEIDRCRGGIFNRATPDVVISRSRISNITQWAVSFGFTKDENIPEDIHFLRCRFENNSLEDGVFLTYVREVTVEDSTFIKTGIRFYQTATHWIINCTFTGGDVRLWYGRQVTIMDSTITNSNGIILEPSDNNNATIDSCLVRNCEYGVQNRYSRDLVITKTTMEHCNVSAMDVWYATIEDCIIRDNVAGVIANEPDSIRNNLFYGNGLTIDEKTNVVSHNFVNDRELLYLYDKQDLVIDRPFGQIILIECEDITIRDQVLNATDDAIYLRDSSDCWIENSLITGNHGDGIRIANGESVSIVNSDITGNDGSGIYATATPSLLISGTKVIGNGGHGAYLPGCNGMLIMKLVSENNSGYGLFLSGNYGRVYDSNISANGQGVSIVNCYDVIISRCNVMKNRDVGVELTSVGSSSILDSLIHGNNDTGILIWGNGNIVGNTTILGHEKDGIRVEQAIQFDVKQCYIRQNTVGVTVQPDTVELMFDNNSINANGYGMMVQDDAGEVSAEQNWWGHSSGPHHQSSNTGGSGDSVSDGVRFDPWLITPPFPLSVQPTIVSIQPAPANLDQYIEFKSTVSNEIMVYSWRSDIHGELYNGSDHTFQISSQLIGIGSHTIYLRIQNICSQWSEEVDVPLVVARIPMVTVQNPQNGSTFSGTVQVKGRMMEQGTLQISFNGGEWINITTSLVWEYKWDTTKQENGPCTISIRMSNGVFTSPVISLTVHIENEEGESEEGFLPIPTLAVVLSFGIVAGIVRVKRINRSIWRYRKK
jgi:parallel beta-helix repeat protein